LLQAISGYQIYKTAGILEESADLILRENRIHEKNAAVEFLKI